MTHLDSNPVQNFIHLVGGMLHGSECKQVNVAGLVVRTARQGCRLSGTNTPVETLTLPSDLVVRQQQAQFSTLYFRRSQR